jgi:NAD(P)H-dependent FMN reductase
MRILAISGSLRASSSNTALLDAAVALAPSGIQLERYTGLGELPHFNPDLDDEHPSSSVKEWRSQLQAADAVIFSTPEYAHGIPGVLKNALDWVVGSGEFAGKPVTLFNASPRGAYAQAALTEILTVMSARVVAKASITINLLGSSLTASQIAADPTMSASLRAGLEALIQPVTNAI